MRIGLDPDLFVVGGIVLTWHGLFTIIAVVLGVSLMIRWARRKNIVGDTILTAAVWAIIGGIIGARTVHVIDMWSSYYGSDPAKIVMLWNGGLDVFGGLLGGLSAVYLYHIFPGLTFRMVPLYKTKVRLPLLVVAAGKADTLRFRNMMDVAALALPWALLVGRIAGLLDGSESGTPTTLPWGITYSHPDTRAYQSYQLLATHPAVAYEALLNLGIFGVLWFLKDRVKPEGMLFAIFIGLYSINRFFIGFSRLNKEWLGGMDLAQILAILVLIVTVPLVSYRTQFVKPDARTVARSEKR
jgi:phosphatidylglycerol:prolipoprotein diacylglycerol transferase